MKMMVRMQAALITEFGPLAMKCMDIHYFYYSHTAHLISFYEGSVLWEGS